LPLSLQANEFVYVLNAKKMHDLRRESGGIDGGG
jgi:hypothetical protein